MKNVLEALNHRYATQEFKADKVPQEKLDLLLDAARLAPSSFGLQPWKMIVVENPEVRKKLRLAAWDQPKVTDAPHLVVFAARTDVDEAYVDRYIEEISKTRGVPVEALAGFSNMMKSFINGRSKESVNAWSARQVYIALGFLLETAAIEGIDAGPMEGFDPAKVDEILELKKHNATSCLLIAIGYRSPTDKAAAYKKVRFAKDEIVSVVR